MNALETSIEKDKNMKTLLDNLKLVFVDNTNNELLKLKYSEIVNVFTNNFDEIARVKKIYDLKDTYGIEEGDNFENYMNTLESKINTDHQMQKLLYPVYIPSSEQHPPHVTDSVELIKQATSIANDLIKKILPRSALVQKIGNDIGSDVINTGIESAEEELSSALSDKSNRIDNKKTFKLHDNVIATYTFKDLTEAHRLIGENESGNLRDMSTLSLDIPATISGVNNDGTYDIEYIDGEKEEHVPQDRIIRLSGDNDNTISTDEVKRLKIAFLEELKSKFNNNGPVFQEIREEIERIENKRSTATVEDNTQQKTNNEVVNDIRVDDTNKTDTKKVKQQQQPQPQPQPQQQQQENNDIVEPASLKTNTRGNIQKITDVNTAIEQKVKSTLEPLLAPFRDDFVEMTDDDKDTYDVKPMQGGTIEIKTNFLTDYINKQIPILFNLFNDGFKYIFAIPIQHKNLNLFLSTLYATETIKKLYSTDGNDNHILFYKDIIALMFIDGDVKTTKFTQNNVLNDAMSINKKYPYKVTNYTANYITFLNNFGEEIENYSNITNIAYEKVYNIVDMIIMYKFYFSNTNQEGNRSIRYYLAARLYTFFKYNEKIIQNKIWNNRQEVTNHANELFNNLTQIKDALDINGQPTDNLTLKQIIQNINADKILTIIKINNYSLKKASENLHIYPYIYNSARYEPFLKAETNDINSSMLLAYKNDTNKYYDDDNEDEIKVTGETSLKYGQFGPFNHIFKPNATNEDMANHHVICDDSDATNNNIYSLIERGKNVFMLGYGSSGAGKTRSLFGAIETINGKPKVLKGIVSYMVENIAKKKDFSVQSYEFYMSESGQLDKNDENLLPEYKIGDTHYRENLIAEDRGKITFIWDTTNDDYKLVGQNVKQFNHNNTDQHADSHLFQNTNFENVMNYIISKNRLERPTMNNPNSSRSHVVSIFDFSTETETETKNKGKLIIGDLAGVENTFNENSIYTLKMFYNKINVSNNKIVIDESTEDTFSIQFTFEPQNMEFEINVLLQTVQLKSENIDLYRNTLRNLIKGMVASKKIDLTPINDKTILTDDYEGNGKLDNTLHHINPDSDEIINEINQFSLTWDDIHNTKAKKGPSRKKLMKYLSYLATKRDGKNFKYQYYFKNKFGSKDFTFFNGKNTFLPQDENNKDYYDIKTTEKRF